MKQIDLINAGTQASDGALGKLQAQIQQALKSGSARAQDTLAQILSKGLDNHYFLVRNLLLPGEDKIIIPSVLVGPACLIVFHPTDVEGFFRAREDTWMEMEKNSQNYRTAARNLIQETQTLAARLDDFMQAGDKPYPEIQAVLFCANTGVRIESIRPSVRILQLDAVDRYLSGLLKEEPLLDARQVQGLVDWLTSGAKTIEAAKPKPAEEKPAAQKAGAALSNVDAIIQKAHLKRRQWIILAAMAGGMFLLLLCLILVIFLTV